jgi:hypothetical protein
MTREAVLRSAWQLGGVRSDVEVWSMLADQDLRFAWRRVRPNAHARHALHAQKVAPSHRGE